MGRTGIVLVETKNYKWMLWTGRSVGEHYAYHLELRRKSDDGEIHIPRSPYTTEDSASEECDKAWKELEDENKARHNYEAMTKDQLALADMYDRMKRAEWGEEHFRRLYTEGDELIQKMRKAGGMK